ncbi:MAG: hypothetical protein K8F91_26340, partial [Candidatus Obscuribacterales bacterium]|nr:hypothetical protein [Candidatus Obscuribacterales bacterium]
MPEEDNPRINPGYPLRQLFKALSSTEEQASKRVEQWQQVLSGLFDGTLRFGSRTPVATAPAWVTLEVIHGGFATGTFAAAGPLKPYEVQKIKMLEKPASVSNSQEPDAVSQTVGRSVLNLYFVSALGRPELTELLANGCFRIQVPEEGALLIATWLMNKGEPGRAARLIDTIAPFFEQLRFYPVPNIRPTHTSSGVYVQTAGDSLRSLRAKRPQTSVQCMNEAIEVWTPLYDRVVSLFLDTVDGDMPNFETTPTNQLVRAANGQPIVEGGWPCRHYPEDWTSRARKLLKDYEDARRQHSLCKKPDKPKENFARLRTYLLKAIQAPSSLTGRDVAMIRKVLASYVSKHGAPGSERLQQTRTMQESMVQRSLHHVLACVLADRLQDQPEDEGVPELQKFLGPLSLD